MSQPEVQHTECMAPNETAGLAQEVMQEQARLRPQVAWRVKHRAASLILTAINMQEATAIQASASAAHIAQILQ